MAILTDKEIIDWADNHMIGGAYSCSPQEMQRMLDVLKLVPFGGIVCEIGVLCGRSASLYFLENKRRTPIQKFIIHLIDSWVLNESDARPCFDQMVCLLDRPLYFDHWKPSQRAVNEIPNNLDFLHIDADHVGGAWDDCSNYLPKVNLNGVVAVHDYADEDYPEVTKAVDHYITEGNGWWRLPLVGRLFTAKRLA